MGHNFPKQLAITLKDAAQIKFFVESGTYKAQTALWAAQHFAKVYTIEAYRPRYEKTLASIPSGVINRKRINFIFGDSRIKLAEVLEQIVSPAIIYLDAHWCGEGAHDSNGDECPLLQELTAINADQYSDHHMIIIDDARLFEAPPPYPHDPKQWPPLATFINKIGTGKRFVMVDHDMIVSIPFQYREILQQNWY